MKAHEENSDEILNSFVDGELSARQRTEVKRLAAHDEDVAERLRRIKNGRNLLRLLPREEPPPEIYENVRLLLERKSLLGERSLSAFDRPKRYAVLRKISAAAAVLLLIGGLMVLVYNIMSPLETPENGTVAELSPAIGPVGVAREGIDSAVLHATYQLHLAAATDLAGELAQVVADQGLTDQVDRQDQDGREIFHFSCAKKDLDTVLVRLNGVWGAVNEARLVLSDDFPEDRVVMERAVPSLVARVLDQDTAGQSRQLAQRMAGYPAEGTMGQPESIPPIDRPVLTAGTATPNPVHAMMVGEGQVEFTIEFIHDSQ